MSTPASESTKPATSDPTSTDESKSPQEVLTGLERTYIERLKELTDLKDQLTKLHEQLACAHDAAFKAYQTLSVTKEQYLVNVITTQQTQLKKLSGSDESTPARVDNL